MCHYAKLTVSPPPAAVTIDVLKPLADDVLCVTPPLNVAVTVSTYFNITIPDPPFFPLPDLFPPPPPPVFAAPSVDVLPPSVPPFPPPPDPVPAKFDPAPPPPPPFVPNRVL